MITWALILILSTSNGVSTTSIRFHSPQSCEEAKRIVEKKDSSIKAFCVADMNINE